MNSSRSIQASRCTNPGRLSKLGLKVIAHMKLIVEKFNQRYGMHFVLEQTPAESTHTGLPNWT